MEEILTVALDAMGGDHSPDEIIKGAVQALEKKRNIRILLTGPQELLREKCAQYTYDTARMEIVNATEVIGCDEAPVSAIRHKKDSSIVVALQLVKDKRADAFVSAGSTGAVLVGAQMIVGRMRGVRRPPLGVFIPTTKGVSLLVDNGANVDARPEHLLQFARLGSVYYENAMGVKSPRVAIVNIGVEEEKGNALVKAAYPLLKECPDIHFTGSIEAREIPHGGADVIVCEGFTGNVILKLYEGVGGALISEIKKGMMSSVRSKLGALLVKPALKDTLKRFDASEYGGAPLLGLNGLVVKTHGSSKAKEVCNSLIQCLTFKEQRIHEQFERLYRQPETEESPAP
ncbi:MAG: phosphate acyltransferase PlsX [Lachnospiraceae bacterium]|jgi:glycerol-3-phosphate acyltransferase PlsX|nr:phosphate acyltransferase PlsX [Lachnospiraceae bacterium]